jgi:hypothetical protein
MEIVPANGRTGLPLNLLQKVDVITPSFVAGLHGEEGSLAEAIHNPIASRSLATLVNTS